MKRSIRRSLDVALTGLGIGIIFSAIVLSGTLDVRAQLPIALVGVLLMEAGVWGLSSKFFPSERRYLGLRSEGDKMMQLIRELNSAAIAKDTGAEDAKRFQSTLEAMHESVVRMSTMAALQDGDKPIDSNESAS